MKKLFCFVALYVLLGVGQIYAQSKAYTPAPNAPERKAILAVVKKKFPKMKKETAFKVQGNWARVVYDMKKNGSDWTANVVLKKTAGKWKIVWDFTDANDSDINDYVKGVPEGIQMTWNK